MNANPTNALVVEPDKNKAKLLRTAADSHHDIDRIDAARDFTEASSYVSTRQYELIFISDTLPEEKLREFHGKLMKQDWARECACILLVPTMEQKRVDLLKKLIGKIHGVLCEPFSVETFSEALLMATKVKEQAEKERIQRTIEIAVVDVMTYIDARSTSFGTERANPYTASAVRKMRETLEQFSKDYPELYETALIARFSHAAKNKIIPSKTSYSGASSRVKKRMEKKLKEKLLESLDQESSE